MNTELQTLIVGHSGFSYSCPVLSHYGLNSNLFFTLLTGIFFNRLKCFILYVLVVAEDVDQCTPEI